MTKQGKTTGNLKMRSGPGMQFEPPIAYLVPDTALEILGEDGDWWQVRAAGKEGYVGKKYVAVTETHADGPSALAGDKAAQGLAKPPAATSAKPGLLIKTGGAKPSLAKPGAGKPAGLRPGGAKQQSPKPSPIRPNIPKPGRPRGGVGKK